MRERIEAVDILRGFTIAAMILVNTPGSWSFVYPPLMHAEWHGLTPTDLIFPFFLFIVGISIFYAYQNKSNTKSTYIKIGIRSLKLIGLGLFLNLFLPYFPFVNALDSFRIPGVLQRIGIVFFIASILFINCNWKILLSISFTILIGYWCMLSFVSFPDSVQPTFDRAPNNWVNYIDLNILGKHMWKPDYDPEGLFSTLPAIVSCIFGVLIGKITAVYKKRSVPLLVLISIIFLGIGYIFNMWFPINKAIWSSSFVLVTSGWATLILAIIYYLTDVLNMKFGIIFKYVGMNAITIYFLSSFLSKCFYLIKIGENSNVHAYLYDSIFIHSFLSDKMSSLLYAITVVLFYVSLGYLLYKKKIFIKV